MTQAGLKITACLCMLLDHIGFLFLPIGSSLWIAFRFIGKLAMPLFCFCIAEGYARTRSFPRYALRLAGFAVISQLPFDWMLHGGHGLCMEHCSVGVTLLLGLLALWCWEHLPTVCGRYEGLGRLLSIAAVLCLAILAEPADWKWFGVLIIWAFGAFRERPLVRSTAFLLLCALRIGIQISPNGSGPAELYIWLPFAAMPLALLPILLYNGKAGCKSVWLRYGFYLFYPLHMIVLTALHQSV